jgi:hypothetical protein
VEEPRAIRLIEERWTVIRHAVEAIAIVLAGLWGLYVFVYQERIKPALEPPSLQLTAQLEAGKVVRGVRVAQLNFQIQNTGHGLTDVYAESLNVYGDRYDLSKDPSRPNVRAGKGALDDDRTVATSPRELLLAHARLRDAATGGIPGIHIVLSPGEHFAFSVPVAVKDGRFDELNAELAIVYGRFRPDRHHFARISIVHAKSGAAELRQPPDLRDDDGHEVDFTVQTAL